MERTSQQARNYEAGGGLRARARVNAVETFAAAFKAAVEKREPCIIECMLDIDEMVAPMVAPGSPDRPVLPELTEVTAYGDEPRQTALLTPSAYWFQ